MGNPKRNAERRVFPNPGRGRAFRHVVVKNKIPLVVGVGFSSLGRVQLPRLVTKGSLHAGYYRIGRVYKYQVHRLVALAFSPNKEGKEYVNHIDGNSTNKGRLISIEWCTPIENVQHAVHLGLCNNNPTKRAVKQIFDDGSIQEFSFIAEEFHTMNEGLKKRIDNAIAISNDKFNNVEGSFSNIKEKFKVILKKNSVIFSNIEEKFSNIKTT
ncbi:hypothetical protein C1645_836359 [Glomus cerebriforme]|uniref:HNH nuclease domain-containing protein n=1 Tax=Glomus cerebriforme TaxID=658196 RepID=A0A397S736_9GLOM|nr:hypothetical protein C1645_836359 [Glomus cerebriforme]